MQRENIEWCQFYWFDAEQDNPNRHLPRLLLMGDSIVVGYREKVAKRLAGKALTGAFSTSKIVGDPAIYRELMLALADYPIDLIYFNNGLHGLECSDESYRRGLSDLVKFLQFNTRAKLYWRNTTPITVRENPEQLDERNAIVIRRNKIAGKIMNDHGIPGDDLYSLLINAPELSSRDGFHYNDAGYRVIAEHIMEFMMPNLSDE